MMWWLLMVGCAWISDTRYDEVRDADGDGVLDARFDGEDCADGDSAVGDCDLDRDGHRATPFGGDCDDGDPRVHPDAEERCNGVDDDCDGQIDIGVDEASLQTFFQDDDGDGFGSLPVLACEAPSNAVERSGDCDDSNPNIHPSAAELCDGVDRNCDGSPTNGAADPSPFTYDADGDGWGRQNGPGQVLACEAPVGFAREGDCNDADSNVSPEAFEVCNGVDDNCDGTVDDADPALTGATVFTLDRDQDGFGGVGTEVVQCADPSTGELMYTPGPGVDCNDFDATITTQVSWYLDVDGDGYGASDGSVPDVVSCAAPVGHARGFGDCDDANPLVSPTAGEVCNGLDDNCNGTIDEGGGDFTFYLDDDGDGFGLEDQAIIGCFPPPNYAVFPGDCDDSNPLVHPIALEICNGLDDDCDTRIDDDDLVSGQSRFYVDADGDGHGRPDTFILQCDLPDGFAELGDDCDDDDTEVWRRVSEVLAGTDTGTVDAILTETCDNGLVLFEGIHALSFAVAEDRRLTLSSLDPAQPALLVPRTTGEMITVGSSGELTLDTLDIGPATDVGDATDPMAGEAVFRVQFRAGLNLSRVGIIGFDLDGGSPTTLITLEADARLELADTVLTDLTTQSPLIEAGYDAEIAMEETSVTGVSGAGLVRATRPAQLSVMSVRLEDIAGGPVFESEGDTFRDAAVFDDITAIDCDTFLSSERQDAVISRQDWVRVGSAAGPAVEVADAELLIEVSHWVNTGGVWTGPDATLAFVGNSVTRLQGPLLLGGGGGSVCPGQRFDAVVDHCLFLDHGPLIEDGYIDKVTVDGQFSHNRQDSNVDPPWQLRSNISNPCRRANNIEHTVEQMKLVRYDPALPDEALEVQPILDLGAATPAGSSLIENGEIDLGLGVGPIQEVDTDGDQIPDAWENEHFDALDNCAWREDYACGGGPVSHEQGGSCLVDPLSAVCP